MTHYVTVRHLNRFGVTAAARHSAGRHQQSPRPPCSMSSGESAPRPASVAFADFQPPLVNVSALSFVDTDPDHDQLGGDVVWTAPPHVSSATGGV